MGFQYASVEDAMSRPGLRMVVVSGVPSPWGEAAKGILHIKGLDWTAVRLAYDSEALQQWTSRRDAPVALYNDEPARAGWADILLLAERLAPRPALLPADPGERALVFGLAHEICGEAGLAWSRRLQLVHAGLHNAGGFPERVARYLARKYGYSPEVAASHGPRVAQLLRLLAGRLKARRAMGSCYCVGETLTAVDVYCATAMAMFAPLPQSLCDMDPTTRAVFETRDEATDAALDPVLLEHRDMMYARHLALPLAL